MKKNRSSLFRLLGFIALIPLLFLVSLVIQPSAKATSLTQTLSGYAWGASYVPGSSPTSYVGGIGWISFNCANDNSCTTNPYSVGIDSSGYLHGYAWNPYFGWIQFGGLSSFPSGYGTTADNARLQSGNLTGWARLTMASVTSVLDGYISFSGSVTGGGTYGVTNTNGSLTGQAWGGPDIGWIDFGAATNGTGGCRSGACIITTAPPSVDLKVSTGPNGTPTDGPVTVAPGSTVWLSWTSAGVPAGGPCTTSANPANDKQWASSSRPSASSTFPYVVNNSAVLSIACANGSGGSTDPDSVTIQLLPNSNPPTANLQISTNPPNYVPGIIAADSGTKPWLTWSSNSYATSCVGLGYGFSTGGATSGTVQLGAVTSSQNYQVKCFSADGSSVISPAVGLSINNPSGTCADPATGNPIAVGTASSTYYLLPQARTCKSEQRQCVSTGGVIGLTNDPNYVYSSCSNDPTIIEQ